MGGVASVNCFDRWGRRAPDGPLIKTKTSSGSTAASSYIANEGSAAPSGSNTIRTETVETPPDKPAPETPSQNVRSNRRRPTAMAGASAAAASDTEGALSESESEDSNPDLSVQERLNVRLKALKKSITNEARLKSNFFASSVKVTTDDKASLLVWFPAKKDSAEGKMKPLGSIEIAKIVKAQVAAGNPKAVDVTASVPTPETYTFTFKHQNQCKKFLGALESLIKLKAMT